MPTFENVASYLAKITQVRDEIAAVRKKVDGSELVRATENGVTKPWTIFVEAIVARENMPS